MEEYKIVRYYRDGRESEVIADGLTLDEARSWCSGRESSSRTAELPENVKRTKECGDWFEGYREA